MAHLSGNDARFLLFADVLREMRPDAFVLFTDLDVTVARDPFPWMAAVAAAQAGTVFVGSEDKCAFHEPYVAESLAHCDVRRTDPDALGRRIIFNPGIIGGEVRVVRPVVDAMVAHIERCANSARANDLIVLNSVVRALRGPGGPVHHIVTGPPLHSRYRQYETESTAFLIHK
jgi:hypothetical protein